MLGRGRTSFSLFRLLPEAAARSSEEGWNARDEIGVVMCSRLLSGSGVKVLPGLDVLRDDDSYRLTIPVVELPKTYQHQSLGILLRAAKSSYAI